MTVLTALFDILVIIFFVYKPVSTGGQGPGFIETKTECDAGRKDDIVAINDDMNKEATDITVHENNIQSENTAFCDGEDNGKDAELLRYVQKLLIM